MNGHCPTVCDTCSSQRCEDSQADFVSGTETITCIDVANDINRCLDPGVPETCRDTSGYCDGESFTIFI